MNNMFPFLHPSTASVLQSVNDAQTNPCGDGQNSRFFDAQSMSLTLPASASMVDLAVLAVECDVAVFVDDNGGTSEDLDQADYLGLAQQLVCFADSPEHVLVATLLALNGLESAIRQSTGRYQLGKAPLLKTMIAELPNPSVRLVCQWLLLPTGLNLRNIVWHGFVSELPRPWLALVVVLTRLLLNDSTHQNVEPDSSHQNVDTGSTPATPTTDMFKLRVYPKLERLLTARHQLPWCADQNVVDWLPSGHVGLYRLALSWVEKGVRPVSICAILCILLEQGLRIDWCRANGRHEDSIAQPGAYFVTLDGHGQRTVHDLLLHPYRNARTEGAETQTPNALIADSVIPGATIALLTDLFCSSCGGPNIRAAITHGIWDEWLVQEWSANEGTHQNPQSSWPQAWDVVYILLLSLEMVATRTPITYSPVFSYTAATRVEVLQSQDSMRKLAMLQRDPLHIHYAALAENEFGVLHKAIAMLEVQRVVDTVERNLPQLLQKDSIWTSNRVLEEHELNQQLASKGATRRLLQDVAIATRNHMLQLQESLGNLDDSNKDAHRRKRRSWLRVVHSSQIARVLYDFARLIAMLSLSEPTELDKSLLQKAVHRSRMVVSTVDTFLHSKADRAVQAVLEFSKGKAVKAIVAWVESTKL